MEENSNNFKVVQIWIKDYERFVSNEYSVHVLANSTVSSNNDGVINTYIFILY